MDDKTRNQVRACLDAAATLIEDARGNLYGNATGEMFGPVRVLLDRVETLVDGKDEAREKKNAGDRARRAKKKSPGKKPKRKNPRPRPSDPLSIAGNPL